MVAERKERRDAGRPITRLVDDEHLHIRLNPGDEIEKQVLKIIDDETAEARKENPKATRRHGLVKAFVKAYNLTAKGEPDNGSANGG
jgi:hypothetical protein